MDVPHVAIVMVSFRDPGLIARALEALGGSRFTSFSVVIVENGGREAFDDLIAHLRTRLHASSVKATSSQRVQQVATFTLSLGAEVVCCEAIDNLGYGAGVNIGVEQAEQNRRVDAVWVLNPDTRPEPGALGAMVDHANATGHALVGCRLVLSQAGTVQLYGGIWRPWLARGFNIGLGAPAAAPVDVPAIEASMNYVSGASMYVTRRYLDQVGPMPEHYFLYCEEVDWCLARGDLTLGYAHDAVVWHDHGATIGSNISRKQRSPLSVYLDERNRVLLTRKYYPLRLPVVLVMAVLFLLKYARAGAWRNIAFALRGLLAGVRGERGRPSLFFPPAGEGSAT